jgi:hypothetical protein
MRYLFDEVPNPSPRVFGVPCPEEVEVLPPVIPLLETKAVVVDGLLRGVDDGSIWSLEFEMGSPDYGRLIEHHVAVARAYPDTQVETVVFWGRNRPTPHEVRCGRATLEAHQVFLAAMDGDGELRRLRQVVAEGQSLTSGDILLLATLPLMHHEQRVWDVVAAAAPLAAGLPPHLERGVVSAMGALAYSALKPEERPFLLEVLGRMPVGEELFEDLRHEGEVRGELRRARAAVLEAFEAHFDHVPASVREAVAGVEDLALLSAWLRATVRARDVTAAEQAILGPR